MLQIDMLPDRSPKDRSGGQCQRVAIGSAVVREPREFLFDQPPSNLDAELRVEMLTMPDKIAVPRGRRPEQFGSPLDLYNAPANAFVAGLIGSPRMNFFVGRVSKGAEVTLAIDPAEAHLFSAKTTRSLRKGEPS